MITIAEAASLGRFRVTRLQRFVNCSQPTNSRVGGPVGSNGLQTFGRGRIQNQHAVDLSPRKSISTINDSQTLFSPDVIIDMEITSFLVWLSGYIHELHIM